jgi:LEA14-like dessication related protein
MTRILTVLLLLGVTLSSCTQILAPEIRTVTCCDLKKASGSDAEIGFKVEVYNGNAFPIHIKRHDLQVRLNGNVLGTSKNSEPMVLNPNELQTLDVSVTTSSKQLISGTLVIGLNALMRNDPTTLEVEVVGSLVGSAKGMSKRVRIREKYPIEMHP